MQHLRKSGSIAALWPRTMGSFRSRKHFGLRNTCGSQGKLQSRQMAVQTSDNSSIRKGCLFRHETVTFDSLVVERDTETGCLRNSDIAILLDGEMLARGLPAQGRVAEGKLQRLFIRLCREEV